MTMKPAARLSLVAGLFLPSLGLVGPAGCGGAKSDAPQFGVTRAAITGAVGPEVTQLGNPIAKIINPTGGGSKTLNTIHDGVKPDATATDPLLQYDTYETSMPVDSKTEDWIGYQFGTTVAFSRVLFQEGMEFRDGGWFETLNVQVRQGMTWTNVSSLNVSPPYQPHNGANFDTYTLDFAPVSGDAIRIQGPPGGAARFISVAELQVWVAPGTAAPPMAPPLGPEITGPGTPIAKISTPNNPPTGGGNKTLGIIQTNGMIDPGSATADQQYDTFTGDASRTEDWIGYSYDSTQFFAHLLFQDGIRFPDGGWFETLQVQVRQNGVWMPVPSLRFTPNYPTDGSSPAFSTYQIDFAPIGGDGIRLFGRPGGASRFIDVASLRVFSGNPCAGQPDGADCSDGDVCTSGDRCLAGVCQPVAPFDCGPPEGCHPRGVCQRETGECTRSILSDTVPDPNDPTKQVPRTCDDGNGCTSGDSCHQGVCIPGSTNTCTGPTSTFYASITNLGSFQGQSVARDINEQGMVAGTEAPGFGSPNVAWYGSTPPSRVFRWTEQGGMTYDPPVGTANIALGMNASGVITGVTNGGLPTTFVNVLRSDPALGPPAAIRADAGGAAINDTGVITGWGNFDNEPGVRMFRMPQGGTPEVLKSPDGSSLVGNMAAQAIDSQGNVVGYALRADNSGEAAVLVRQDGVVIDLNELISGTPAADPRWDLIEATAIRFDEEHNTDTILGWGTFESVPHAFELVVGSGDPPRLSDLKSLAPYDEPTSYVHLPIPHRMNSHGEIVGAFYDRYQNWPMVAFVRVPGQGMIRLNDLIDPQSGWNLAAAFAINDNREIVGFGYLNGEARGYRMKLPDLTPCEAVDSCHEAPRRDPLTGTCSEDPTPAVADGTACSGETLCPDNNVCLAGVCGGNSTVCLRVDGVVDAGNGKLKAVFGYDSQGDIIASPTPNEVFLNGYPLADPIPPPPRSFAASTPQSAHPGAYQPIFDSDKTISWQVGGQRVSAIAQSTLLTPLPQDNGDEILVIDGVPVTVKIDTRKFTEPPGPITPDSPPTNVPFNGALSGSLAVSPSGAATYNVPIAVPPGIAGVAPNLSLVYNSQAGDGLAGQGWELSGLSAIHRCPKTLVRDGAARPIEMRSDDGEDGICLDGKRLFRGDDPQVEQYFSESRDFTEIKPDPASHGFVVKTKTGERRYYGSRPDGLVHFDSQNPDSPAKALIAIWPLTRVVDAWGNYMDFHYNNDQRGFAQAGFWVSRIDYTGHLPGGADTGPVDQPPFYSVNFTYQTRVDVRRVRFGDFVVPKNRRLSRITVTAKDSTDDVRSYDLAYKDPPNTHNETVDEMMLPSRLGSIHYCARTVAKGPQECLDDATFDWEGGGYSWVPAPKYAPPAPMDRTWVGGPNGSGYWSTHGTQLIDLDGDGRMDLLQSRATSDNSQNKAWLNRPTGWAERPDLALPLPLVDGDGAPTDVRLADLDGDGLVDFIAADNFHCFGPIPNSQPVCRASTSLGHCHAEQEIVGTKTQTVCRPDPDTPIISPFVWLNRIPYGQGWQRQTSGLAVLPQNWGQLAFKANGTTVDQMADMDGNGRADIVRMNLDDSENTIDVLYNHGSSWSSLGSHSDRFFSPAALMGSVFKLRHFHLEDFNRDGMADLVLNNPVQFQDSNGVPLAMSIVGINIGWAPNANDNNFWRKENLTSTPAVDQPWATALRGDVDGDGLIDTVAAGLPLRVKCAPTDPVDPNCSCPDDGSGAPVICSEGIITATTVRFSTGSAYTALGNDGWQQNAANARLPSFDAATGNVGDYNFSLADINADGLVEFVNGHHGGGQVLFNTGSGWHDLSDPDSTRGATFSDTAGADSTSLPVVPDASTGGGHLGAAFVDLDGDGITDLVQARLVNGQLQHQAWLNTFKPPLIKKFPNGLAAGTEIKYAVITAATNSAYTEDNILATGTTRLMLPLRVVASTSAVDGSGVAGGLVTKYQYFDLRGSAFQRGPQGFRSILVTDSNGSRTKTTYSQVFPYTGMPVEVAKYKVSSKLQPDGLPEPDAILSKTTTTYCDRANPSPETCAPADGPSSGRYYSERTSVFVAPYTIADTTYLYFDDPAQRPGVVGVVHLPAKKTAETITTTTAMTYDEHGNSTITNVITASSAGELYQKTTINDYGPAGGREWQEGKPKETAVTTFNFTPGPQFFESTRHTTDFSYDVVNTFKLDGVSGDVTTFALTKTDVEKSSRPEDQLRTVTVVGYDGHGNVTTTTQCAADFDNCSPTSVGPAGTPFRTTAVSFMPADFTPGSGQSPVTTSIPPYGPGRFPVKTTNAEGHKEYTLFDPLTGAVIQKTDPNGVHSCAVYDQFGRKRSETARCGSRDPLTTTTDYVVDAIASSLNFKSSIAITRLPTGGATWSYLDKFSRETEARALGFSGKSVQVKTTQFDAKGRATFETKPRFDSDRIHFITRVFDDLDRISTVTQTLGTLDADNPDASVVVKTSYEGARIDTSNQVNGLVSHQRWEIKNALGKVASVTDTLGVLAAAAQGAETAGMHTMSYEYDPEGSLTGSTDPAGNHVTIHYDGRGRKDRMTDPDLGEWKYTYDGFGQLITQKDPKHDQLTTMTYDRLGRALTRSDVDGTSQWIYDTAPGKGVGKLAGTAGPMDARFSGECSPPSALGNGVAPGKRAIRWSEYSDLGDPIESFECTDGDTFNVSTAFVQARPSVVRYPAVQGSRMAVSYHYNAAGYLQYLMDDGPNKLLWAAMEANAQGQITREVTANGVETVNERNPSTGWLMHTESHAQLEFDNLIQNWTYGYDEVGNLRHRDQADLAHKISTREGFTYDELDRLKTAETTFLGGGTVGSESFDYDAIGNVTRKGDLGYSYVGCGGGPHAVCSIGDQMTLAYDANGNFSSGGGRTVQFNGRDKAVHMVGNNALVDLIYGPEGNRAVQLAGTSEGDPMAERTVYVGMGSTGKGLYERTTKPGSTEHVHFLYAGSAHGGAAFAVRTVTVGSSGTASTATRYAHFDHLGSVTALSDETGHVAGGTPSSAGTSGLWSYDSWGAMRSSDGGGTSQPNIALPAGHRGFTGHETMPHIGLVNMNGRIYDPVIGRFLSPDPTVQFVANLQSYNRYSYVLNNPLRYTDPTGYSLNKWNYLADVLVVAAAVVVCVESVGTGCTVAIGFATTFISTQSAIANGTPWDQAVSLGIIEFALFMLMANTSDGPGSQAVGLGGMAQGVGSAAVSAAFSTSVADLSANGELGWNVLENAAISAAVAAFIYGVSASTAKVTQASAAQGGAYNLADPPLPSETGDPISHADTPQERIDRIKNDQFPEWRGRSVIYDPTLPKGRGMTSWDPDKQGPGAVMIVRVGPSALSGEDSRVAMTLRHELDGHVAAILQGAHPALSIEKASNISSAGRRIDRQLNVDAVDNAFHMKLYNSDVQYAVRKGWFADAAERLGAADRYLVRINAYVNGL